MEETFFVNCGTHENTRKKNEKNIFCLQCCVSFCPQCLLHSLHENENHHLLQVRRYVYHDVVIQADLEKLIDCSYIQPYTINSAKVIFIKERPLRRPCFKVATNLCFNCQRILQHTFNFCSISCEVNHYEYQGMDLSSILQGFNDSDLLTFYDIGGLICMDGNYSTAAMTDEAEEEEEVRAMHGCTSSMRVDPSSDMEQEQHGKETSKMKKRQKEKWRSNEGLQLQPMVQMQSLGNRRKGAPHRSPLA